MSRGAALDAANGAGEDPEAAARARLASFVSEYRVAAAAVDEATAREGAGFLTSEYLDEDLTGEESEEDEEELREEADAALVRLEAQRSVVDLLADVRAAGGWPAYVAAPRAQLLELRAELLELRRGPSAVRAHERLFLDRSIPDDVVAHVRAFWRSDRDA
jgi:hypothetical protein